MEGKDNIIVMLTKQLNEKKEEIRNLKSELKEYKNIMEIGRKREYHSKFLKDFQEERGKNVFPDHDEIYKRYDKQKEIIERLNSIIKEVREFVEKRKDTQMFRKNDLKEVQTNIDIVLEQYDDILEILDKENK